jgi:hypothetical protein
VKQDHPWIVGAGGINLVNYPIGIDVDTTNNNQGTTTPYYYQIDGMKWEPSQNDQYCIRPDCPGNFKAGPSTSS